MSKRSKRARPAGPPDPVRQMLARYVATADMTRNRPMVDERGLTAVWVYARASRREEPLELRSRGWRRATRPTTTLSDV